MSASSTASGAPASVVPISPTGRSSTSSSTAASPRGSAGCERCPACGQRTLPPEGRWNAAARVYSWADGEAALHRKPAALFDALWRGRGETVSYADLGAAAWGRAGAPAHERQTLSRHVDTLRRALAGAPLKILLEYGRGYILIART